MIRWLKISDYTTGADSKGRRFVKWQGIMQRKTNERTDENHDSKRERMYELKDSPPRTTNSLIKQLCSSLQLNTTQPLYISMVHINKIILS